MRQALFRVLVAAITLLQADAARSQDAVTSGDRVRIKTSNAPGTIVGTVGAVLADRIDLVEGRSVSRSSIRRIYRSGGIGTCTKRGALIGLFGGFASGAYLAVQPAACLAVQVCRLNEQTGEFFDCRGAPCSTIGIKAVVLNAAAGAGIGALIGRFVKRERWSAVQLSITASPSGSAGAFSPAIRVALTW